MRVVPDGFLNAETRCEYRIDERMKKIWAVQLDLLERFIEICRKHNLRYYAIGGTLIGCVRHGGFIPWDDDIDVAMPRADYDAFARIAQAELPDPLFFQTPLTDAHQFRLFYRLRNSVTTGIADKRHKHQTNNGIFLDIFPLDAYDPKPKYNLFVKATNLLQRTAEQKFRYVPGSKHPLKGRALYWFSKRLNYPWAYRWHQKRCAKLSRDHTDFIGQCYASSLRYPLEKMVWPRDAFDEVTELPFEYLTLACPAGYDRILRRTYGDYMAFPPVEQRGKHHTIVFDTETPYKQYCAEHYGVIYDE